MATESVVADAARAETGGSPLLSWYLDRFRKHLPAIRESELLTTYFSTSYGELYEFSVDFIRVLRLIDDTDDQESISGEVRRLGWKWYRVAEDRDHNVRREINGDWVRMTEDDLEKRTEKLRDERWSEQLKQQHKREAASAAEHFVDITTGKLGEITRTTKSLAEVLPCYLFHVRYPNDGGEDLWTAKSLLEGLGDRSEEEAVYWICYQLLPLGGRVKTLLRQTAEVLENPSLLKDDIDQRRKTRSVDLESVNSQSAATATRISAASKMQQFLARAFEDVR
jgi:hypothetical protein